MLTPELEFRCFSTFPSYLEARSESKPQSWQSHGTEQERNGQKDQAVLWGIRHQNRYAEDANNSTDQPEKHCGARDDTYADQRKQVDCQRDRGG